MFHSRRQRGVDLSQGQEIERLALSTAASPPLPLLKWSPSLSLFHFIHPVSQGNPEQIFLASFFY